MSIAANDLNLVLITDRPDRAMLLHDMMQDTGVSGVIRRITPGANAIHCARQTGSYRHKNLPDLFLYDFSAPDKHQISILRELAFSQDKATVPVVLLTSPESLAMLDAGDIDGGGAVMFSPSTLGSFVKKMRSGGRKAFFKALRTLYQFGPILVRTPDDVLAQDIREQAIPA